jgi:serine/threonine protein kinase
MEREVVQTDADRYIIVEYLAEGGMGAIFLGKKVGMEGFEKEVVLNQLLPEFTSQPEFIDLFLREAKLSAALDHANIVHTIDLVAAGDDYFIVMEFVRGGDLRSILRRIKQRGQQLDAAAAIFITREVLSALAYAHEKKSLDGKPLQLIHRDISPSNIMVSGAGEVKLTDFGIAKVSTHKSVFYRVKGKVGYMSPEQAYGDRPMDLRSDLYSLGVCLHELLSGERLFVADLLSTPDQIYGQGVPKLEVLPGIPQGIDHVLSTALAMEPDERYQTALEFQDGLMKVAYDNGMLLTAPDLAQHLRDACGENPDDWRTEEEQDDRPGTEVLHGESSGSGESSDSFSGVELTSVFTGLPQQLGPQPADSFLESGDRSRRAGGSHNRRPASKGLAYAPTRLAIESPRRHSPRQPAGPTFDVSDYEGGEYPADNPHSLRPVPTDPIADPFTEVAAGRGIGDLATDAEVGIQDMPTDADGGIQDVPTDADRSSPGYRGWREDDDEEEETGEGEPTLAIDKAPAGVAENAERPASASRSPRYDTHGTDDQEATVELRVHKERMNGAPRGTPPPDAFATAHVDPGQEAAVRSQRQPLLVVAAFLLLLLSGVVIVVVVGLTGPDLGDNDGFEPKRKPVGKGGEPNVIPLAGTPDAGRDQQHLALASPDLSPPIPDSAPAGQQLSSERSLRVQSTPRGAKVFLDKMFQCLTPCTIVELEEDKVYLLSVRKKRFVSWSSLIDMRGRPRVHINAYLSEKPDKGSVGYLLLRSTRPADVFVDGKEIGRVTTEGPIPLPPGQYEITLSHPRRTKKHKMVIRIHQRQTVLLWPKF